MKQNTMYEVFLKRMEELIRMNPEPNTKEYKELQNLGSMLLEYEDKNYPIEEIQERPSETYMYYDNNGLPKPLNKEQF